MEWDTMCGGASQLVPALGLPALPGGAVLAPSRLHQVSIVSPWKGRFHTPMHPSCTVLDLRSHRWLLSRMKTAVMLAVVALLMCLIVAIGLRGAMGM
jgi:hypothetical protein